MSDSRTGTFVIGGTKPGEARLELHMVVVGDDVAAIGHFSWAVNPPQDFIVIFTGQTHSTGLGTAHQLFALQGTAFPELYGAPNIPTLSISLDGIWGTSGTASYGVWHDTPVIQDFPNQPVSVTWKA